MALKMAESTEFAVLEVPARIANLALQFSAPRDWNLHDLPGEDVDFSVPTNFFPLVVLTAPWAAIALTIAARPGFENGTLQDWSLFLLEAQGIRPTALAPAAIGNVPGLAGVGRQQQEGTWLEVRFAFFEDGGRLVHIGLIAPEAISAPLQPAWNKAVESFELRAPQGQTATIGPGLGFMPAPEPAAEPDEPPLTPLAPRAPEPVAASTVEIAAAPEPIRQFTDADLGYYAKSADAATLDQEHPTNARLRDQGVGFVPNVLETDLEAKTAKIGAGAIQAIIRVALGWHVNDDGKRTLLLDPAGKIQISLHLIATEGRSADLILDDLQAEAERSYDNPEFLRLRQDGIWGLAVRNILVNDEPVEQIHLLTVWRMGTALLRARVTCDPDSTRFAVDYADLILKSAEYGDDYDGKDRPDLSPNPVEAPPREPSNSDGPTWWKRAGELEREDRLDEAEQLVRDRIPNLCFAIQIAEMYRLRWIRLKQSDPEKAQDARKRAADWAWNYAASATSGGEGVALSRERDEFLRSLGPDPL